MRNQLFSFDWYFKHNIADDELHTTDLIKFQQVNLPHDWSIEFPFDENSLTCGSGGYVTAGIGVYKKKFKLEESAWGKRVYILFDGAYMHSDVWLNGRHLGLQVYGYTYFEFDITDCVDYKGENILTVKVNNSNQPNSRWYSGSGITRDVWLSIVDHIHVKTYGTYITTPIVSEKIAHVRVKTTIVNHTAFEKRGFLHTKIVDKNGKSISLKTLITIASGEHEFEQLLTIDKPLIWSIENPNLYEAVTTLIFDDIEKEDNITDDYKTTFGIRTVEFDAQKGFFLNNRHTKINGVCLHHDGGCVGAAVPQKVWERRLIILKEMGVNGIRCSHNPPDNALLDLCDKMGFLVMDEAFDEWKLLKSKHLGSNTHSSRGYSECFEQYHEDDLLKMLYRDRNHPSIIMWSIGNEVPEQRSESGHLLAKKLQDICHSIDPTRLVTQACDNIAAEPEEATKEFLDTLDIVGYNYVGRWRKRVETLYDDDKRTNPDWLIIGTENPSASGIRGKYILDASESEKWSRPYYTVPVRVGKLLKYTMTRDFVAGDFMWTGIDHLGESHWPSRSASCGVLDTCGFKKDYFYFYQSVWRQDIPVIYAYPHWNMEEWQGRIIPVICFTNCEFAELFLNGKSYGKKSRTYPDYGMTKCYAHFDKPPKHANTDDLFLSWDVPYEPGEVVVIDYNDGIEACSYRMVTTGKPAKIEVNTDTNILKGDGRDIAQIEIRILDENGNFVPNIDDVQLRFIVEGNADLIGVDNGKPDSLESFKGSKIKSFGGMAYAIVKARYSLGTAKLSVSADGYETVTIDFDVIV